MRVFFAHPKSMADEEIDDWCVNLKRMFREAEYSDPEIVPGRDDFQRYAVGAGSFSAWAREVPLRKDMASGKPYYSCFVSVNAYVGRATADIMKGALNAGTPVLLFDRSEEDGPIEPKQVSQVMVVDPDDYLKGWCLDT